jgi:hypothetical protein
MKSIGQMISQLFGLTDTKDLTDWENQFVKDIVEKTNGGASTKMLTPKQIEIIDRIYQKHFV